MHSKLNDEQKNSVEATMGYIPFVLNCLFPFIPMHLYDDCYAVACETLCECALRYNPAKSKFSTYAVSAMRKNVMKFLIGESTYESTRIHECTSENAYDTINDDLLSQLQDCFCMTPLETVEARDTVTQIMGESILDNQVRLSLCCIADGMPLREISEILGIPLPRLRRKIMKAQKKIREKWGEAS